MASTDATGDDAEFKLSKEGYNSRPENSERQWRSTSPSLVPQLPQYLPPLDESQDGVVHERRFPTPAYSPYLYSHYLKPTAMLDNDPIEARNDLKTPPVTDIPSNPFRSASRFPHARSPIQTPECPYCNADFNSHELLKTHLVAHNFKKPYCCQICGTRFKRGNTLQGDHWSIESKDPSVCVRCKEEFAELDAELLLRYPTRVEPPHGSYSSGESHYQVPASGKDISNTGKNDMIPAESSEKQAKVDRRHWAGRNFEPASAVNLVSYLLDLLH